jgi:hypothetical protein
VRRPVQLIALVALAAGAAACGDPSRTDRDVTEAIFLETCAPGGSPLEVEVCQCAFDRIVDDLDDDELERLDRNLRDEPDVVPPEVTEAALECAAEPLTPSTPRSTTTSTTEPD